MTPHDRLDQRLTEGLEDLAGTSRPDYRNAILGQVARTRQRPAWTFPERWIPMALIAQRPATAPPLRRAWTLLLIAAITLALAAGLAIAGARLLGPPRPEDRLHALVPVPVLDLVDTLDASSIDGLSYPTGMDVGPDGDLYVVNGGTNEILVIDPDGKVIDRWGSQGSGPGQFDFQRDAGDPKQALGGVAVAPDGSVYVADLLNDRVQQLSATGEFVREWGGYGPGDGQFLEPIDVAVGPDGTVYVVDDRRDDIQRFNLEGTYLQTIGRHGTGDGELNFTSGIAVDDAGTILNADWDNLRMQAWDADGMFLWSHRTASAEHPDSHPGDVGAAAAGTIYLTDPEGLHVFGPERDLLSSWTPPPTPVKDDWYTVATASDGVVYVASPFNSLIWRLSSTTREVEMAAAPSPTALPSAPASSAPTAAATPSAAHTTFASGSAFPVRFTLSLPPHWASTGSASWVRRTGGSNTWPAYVGVDIPTNAYADPCQAADGPASPPVGPAVEDLAAALAHAVGFRSGPISEVTIDGYLGVTFELDNNIDISTCSDDPWLRQWTTAAGEQGNLSGAHQRIAILDVDGTRVLVTTWTFAETLRDEVEEAYQVFDSIDFQ